MMAAQPCLCADSTRGGTPPSQLLPSILSYAQSTEIFGGQLSVRRMLNSAGPIAARVQNSLTYGLTELRLFRPGKKRLKRAGAERYYLRL